MALFPSVRIHPDGWRFIGIFLVVTLVFFYITQPLGWVGVVMTGWCAYFFRNPLRTTPPQPSLIVSPADGIICAIKVMIPPAELEMGSKPRVRISIFLNVFDVHVNRFPVKGTIVKSLYESGKFLNAALDSASDFNERQTLVIQTDSYIKIAVVQIAGLIARRIVCSAQEGELAETGAVFGLIRFGSRADIYLPEGIAPLVCEGQRMIGGETVLANTNYSESFVDTLLNIKDEKGSKTIWEGIIH
jgi:phosphatidylserine decarboxylase